MSETNKTISTGEFQWISGGEPTAAAVETKPKKQEAWFSNPGANPVFSSSNPYVSSEGKELSYEESRNQEWTANNQPTPVPTPPQPQPNFIIPNAALIVGNQQPRASLPRSPQSLPGHPQGMHSAMGLPQRQSMPNLLHPSRPANHQSRMIISPPQAHLPSSPSRQIQPKRLIIPLIAHQHHQGPALLPRRGPEPPIVPQNRFVPQPRRVQMAPHQMQQAIRRSLLQGQPAVVMASRNPMQNLQHQFLLQQHQQTVQAAKVLHPRNGNVNFPPPPQSLIQYNKPTTIVMNQAAPGHPPLPTQLKAAFAYPHHLTPSPTLGSRNHRGHVNCHRNAHRKNKHVNHASGNARNSNESSKNASKFTSVLKPVKNDKLIQGGGAKSKFAHASQTKNLLDYDHRLAYHMPNPSRTSNRPPLKNDTKTPVNEHVVQKDLKPSLKSKSRQQSKLPLNWTELFQSVALAKHITTYLSLHEFLNVFGVLSQTLHDLVPNVGWVDSIVITFGEKRIIFNNDFHLSFIKSKELVHFLKVLSSVSIRHLKLQIEEYSEQIPFEFFKTYFGGSQSLKTIAVNATNTEEAISRKWQNFLIDLDFEHLAIENKPFLLDDWFVKKLAIKALTISSPDYPMTLNLFNNLPNTVKAISICRPSFSISKLLDKVRVNRIYLRNPSRKPPLEPTELVALFTKVYYIELDFSLLGEIPHLKILKSDLKVKQLIFVFDGTSPSLVQKAKAMLSSSAIDVSIKWKIID